MKMNSERKVCVPWEPDLFWRSVVEFNLGGNQARPRRPSRAGDLSTIELLEKA